MSPLAPEQATAKAIENIQFQLRHSNYARSLEIRKFCRSISTGEGQKEEVTEYRMYEDDTLKKQRKRLFNSPTKSVISRPRKYWKRIEGVEGIRRDAQVEKSDESKLEALKVNFDNFTPEWTLEDWQSKTLEYLGVTDPNAMIIYERSDIRDLQGQIQETIVYPFVASCEQVVNFEKWNDILQWVLIRTITIETIAEAGQRRDKMLENYYLYSPGYVTRFREVGETTKQEDKREVVVPIEIFNVPQGATLRNFYYVQIPNGTTEVPGDFAGAYIDELTTEGYVSWFDPAEFVFRDMVRDKMIADVLKIVYAFPKRWQFVKPCQHEDETKGVCEGGYYNGVRNSDNICSGCHGTGKASNFTTEQATVDLILPDGDQTNIPELAKLAFQEPIDTALLDYFDQKCMESNTMRALSAIFDTGIYQKPTGSKEVTATEINAIIQGISDVLRPYCKLLSKHWELAYRIGGQYNGFKVSASKSYPSDLKIESADELIQAFVAAKDSGVGYQAVQAFRDKVFQKLFESDPDKLANIRAMYNHLPFDDKSQESIAMILLGRAETDRDRVLWENFDSIFRDIFETVPDFGKKALKVQNEIVDKGVQDYIAQMKLASDGMGPGTPPNPVEPQPQPNAG